LFATTCLFGILKSWFARVTVLEVESLELDSLLASVWSGMRRRQCHGPCFLLSIAIFDSGLHHLSSFSDAASTNGFVFKACD
jgi:hypothetical protein